MIRKQIPTPAVATFVAATFLAIATATAQPAPASPPPIPAPSPAGDAAPQPELGRPTPTPTEQRPGKSRRAQAAMTVVMLGVGGLAVSGWYGLEAGSKWDQARDAYCRGDVCLAAGLDLIDDARRAALISNIGFAVSAGVAGVGAWWWWREHKRMRKAERLSLRPLVGGNSVGAVAIGVF